MTRHSAIKYLVAIGLDDPSPMAVKSAFGITDGTAIWLRSLGAMPSDE